MFDPRTPIWDNFHLAFALLLLLGFFTQAASAEPFSECPSDAFLVQDTVPKLYGVDLATGHFQLLSNSVGNGSKLNALAFNFHDQYLYAWNYEFQTIARIDSEFQVTPLEVIGMPSGNFYIGDIALENNAMYVYRPGATIGLYEISLDPEHPDYLNARQVADGNAINLRIYDMAFHPRDGGAYSVDNRGWLHRIDITTGTSVAISDVGQAGTYGAVYFDLDENLYISRNNDGNIFRIDTKITQPTAELFAYGPSSSNNDGARCALAPVISVEEASIDFGDAPASYGTSFDQNGARHSLKDSELFLGSLVDAEFDSHQFPLSDDESGEANDEDGIQFVTGIEVDTYALLQVEASAPGYLNAWIDFDRNGVFSDEEQILTGFYVDAGLTSASYNVPSWAEVGTTWARFRLSSTPEIGPTGGVADGEVEDYAIDVTEPNISVSYYPDASGWATIAFEDNWPLIGDYDFNDLIVNYRITEYRRDDAVVRIKLEGKIAAVGASYHNGFAFHLPDVPRSQVDETAIRFLINEQHQFAQPLERDRNNAIIVVAEDIWNYVSPGEDCKYHRTEPGCGSNIQMDFSITVPMVAPVDPIDMPSFPYDPFLFATNNYDHGYVFGMPPGRAYEIHLPGKAPTEAFRTDFFNRGMDNSDAALNRYFVNQNGMPWAINITAEWQYPVEYMDVLYAYPLFEQFIQSEGTEAADWFTLENALLRNTFSN